MTLAQHVRGSEDGTVYLIHSPLAISNQQVYSDSGFGSSGGTQVPLYDDSGNAFRVVSLETNGEQIAFKNYTERRIDDSSYMIESSLYLKNGQQILELSGPQSGHYALGTNAVAWMESLNSSDSLRVYDVPTRQTRTLPVDAAKFSLWDINGRYVLVTSQVVPEPGNLFMVACGALCILTRSRSFVARRQVAAQ